MESAESSLTMIEEIIQLEGRRRLPRSFWRRWWDERYFSAPDGYMEGVRKLCDKYGILMIADEVMADLANGEMVCDRSLEGVPI